MYLPYIAPNTNYGEHEDELFRATVVINGKTI